MEDNTCPRCEKQVSEMALFQCCRCFTVYCKDCDDTSDGRVCPKCKMGSRLILSSKK